MKRYDIGLYDAGFMIEQDQNGQWVRADVAQALYDAVNSLRITLGKITAEPENCSELVARLIEADAVITLADGEDNG